MDILPTQLPERKRKRTELVHLRALPSTEPDSATGRVRWMWPEVEAALASGKSVKEIWQAAQKDGMGIPYAQFRMYVSRIRRERTAQRIDADQIKTKSATAAPHTPIDVDANRAIDPLHNLRAQVEKKRGSTFEYNPFPNRGE